MTKEQKKRLAELRSLEVEGSLTPELTAELKELIQLEESETESHKLEVGEKATRAFDCEVKSIDEEKFELEAIASTDSIDRYGDSVDQASWDLKKFKKNPVILANHFYTVQNVIGKATSIKVVDGKLVMKVKFAVKESELAASVWKLIVGGYLNAWSVGFIPKEFEDEKGKDGKYKRILKDCELLEVSAVAVPANADCLTNAVKAKTITDQEAKTVRKALGEDFEKKEQALTLERSLELLEENKEVLKHYRAAFKNLNITLGLTPSGEEIKDLEATIKMAEFCLGIDKDLEDEQNNNEDKDLEVKSKEDQTANPLEAQARTATQEELDEHKKDLLSKILN